jgi:hypothetical protein
MSYATHFYTLFFLGSQIFPEDRGKESNSSWETTVRIAKSYQFGKARVGPGPHEMASKPRLALWSSYTLEYKSNRWGKNAPHLTTITGQDE